MRDVSVDEVFTWREDFGAKAKEAFGGWHVDVSPQTFSDLKDRCDRVGREADPFFERTHSAGSFIPGPIPLNSIRLHMVKSGEVPDGVLRGCTCGSWRQ